jgi:hypothetical protein
VAEAREGLTVRSRTSFLAERKGRGMSRPLPLKVGVVNARGVTAGPTVVRSILRRASQHADVLLCSEVANVRVALALGDDWQVAQFGAVDSPEAGCAIAVRKTRGKVYEQTKTLASTEGLGIRDRFIVSGRLIVDAGGVHAWSTTVAAIHAPPMRAWAKWPGYMANLAKLNVAFAGGDFNKLARAVQPVLRRKVRAVHIVGLAHKVYIPVSQPRSLDVGSDHPMVVCTLWPTH